MTGSKRLAAFIKSHHLERQDVARALGVSASVLHYWLKGSRPSDRHRRSIEKYSKGEVPVDAWLTTDDRRRTDAVRPFDEPPPSAQAGAADDDSSDAA